jgi:hypothetical protein
VLAFELATGGKVGVNNESTIKVTGVRSIKDLSGRPEITFGQALEHIHFKCRPPLEISTDGGGAMSIKG